MSIKNNIQNFYLKKVKFKSIDVLPQALGEINIYEDLTNPAILGDITIADYQGFNEVGEIFAGDDVEIIMNTEDREELSLKFKIYASDTAVNVNSTFQPITYRFCSEWLIDAMTRQISKAYKEKYIHEIIKDLLSECGAKIGYIEPTKQKLFRFTTPFWTAIKSIHHLLSFAMNEQGIGGYIFWTDLKTGKVNVTTVDYLYNGKHGVEDKKFMSIPKNQFYESKIENVSFDTHYDIIQFVNQGVATSKYVSLFYDKNKTYEYKKKINEIKHKHLGKKLPINKTYTDKKYTVTKFTSLFPSKDDPVTEDSLVKDMVDGRANTRYTRLFCDIFKISFMTQQNSSRRVGHTCFLEYQSEDKSQAIANKQYTGTYVIRNIRHMIFNGIYKQAVTIMNDGFYESKNDLVSWG